MDEDLPEKIGDYRVLRRIGAGASADVFEVEREGRRFALKRLHARNAADPRARERFEREARVLTELDHPALLACHDFGYQDGHFLVLDFIDGESLALSTGISSIADDETVVRGSPAAEQSPATPSADGSRSTLHGEQLRGTLKCLEDVASALHYLHEKGILHRDVKPANILVDRGGRARLTDLGLAKDESEQTMTMDGEFLGTPAYISPEQAMAGRVDVDARTDVYALGVTLYQCVTGKLPFEGNDYKETLRQVIVKEPLPIRKIDPDLPRDLETVIGKALEKDPNRRYQTADAFREDLRALRNMRAPSATPPSLLRRAVKRVRANPWIGATFATVVVSAAAILLAVYLFTLWTQRDWVYLVFVPDESSMLCSSIRVEGLDPESPISRERRPGARFRVPRNAWYAVTFSWKDTTLETLVRSTGDLETETQTLPYRAALAGTSLIIPASNIAHDRNGKETIRVDGFTVRVGVVTLSDCVRVLTFFDDLANRPGSEIGAAEVRTLIAGVVPRPDRPLGEADLLKRPDRISFEAAQIITGYLGGRLPTEAEWHALHRAVESRSGDGWSWLRNELLSFPPELLAEPSDEGVVCRGPYRQNLPANSLSLVDVVYPDYYVLVIVRSRD